MCKQRTCASPISNTYWGNPVAPRVGASTCYWVMNSRHESEAINRARIHAEISQSQSRRFVHVLASNLTLGLLDHLAVFIGSIRPSNRPIAPLFGPENIVLMT